VPNSALGPAALLLAALAGCGGGGAAPTPAKGAAAAVEEEAGAPRPKTAGAAQRQAAPTAPSIDQSLIPPPGSLPVRETFSYSGASRDPFESVLGRGTAGPELADLLLVAVYYNERSPAGSVAVLRDRVSGKRYTVREGERLGRMRISTIRPKDVTFSIDDYGTERQETLTLRKQEGNTP
jgi:hypothetical protein